MSAQDSAQLAAAELKPRPELPPKPTAGTSSLPQEEDDRPGSPSVVNVKLMVNNFSRHRGFQDKPPRQQVRKPPFVKPKPETGCSQSEPPPLPKKRRDKSGLQQAQSTESEDGNRIRAEDGRSDPDGKEVETESVPGKSEDEDVPDGAFSSCHDKSCSCTCHLQRPGMKLVWVPLREEDASECGEGADVSEEEGSDLILSKDVENADGQVEVEEQVDKGSAKAEDEYCSSIREETKLERTKLHPSLDIPSNDSPRRLSDPGPCFTVSETQGSPAPLKQIPCLPVNHKAAHEDIYESRIHTVDPSHNKKTTQGAEHSQVNVPKAARRSKPPEIPRNQSLESVSDDVPPAIPPRMPYTQEARNLTPNAAGEDRASPQASPRPPARRCPPLPPKTESLTDSNQTPGYRNGGNSEDPKEDPTEELYETSPGFSNSWRLQNEPLYQTYRETVITKEIRRQTVSRNISKTPTDYGQDRNEGTLWQNLPNVRDSGVLERLTPEQCKYQESMFEVLTSETSYLRSLHVLTEHFLENRELDGTLLLMEKTPLFSNILRVREVSERFLKDLEDRVFETIVFSDICDIIHYHSQHNFPAYIDYVRNQIYQEKTYTKLMKNNTQFAAIINRLQESPQCHRLPFMSFLLLPFQRITRIKMLIENILKRTKEKTKEEEMASKALASVSKIIDECNTEVGKMRQMEELISLSKMFAFDKLKAIPIISQTRFLEKKGELQEMARGGTVFNMKVKFNPINVFLFNDLLIITSSAVKKGSERFVVLDYAHRSLVQVHPLEDRNCGPYENCFTLILLENHNGRMMERLIKAPSQLDMHRWMAAFPSKEEDDVVYDAWDCPQVQCVQQYVAQQADELNLEPTEIVNVIRKTNEGWWEGIRLSDGQKGWFPVSNIIEITNEHLRRRNLKERYRVIQAASQVTNAKKL
ncbi:ephexin-1 [Corythoichthys intestinalis]|uniref:ephexin-1 n=1 Tax=Corythoichthys intestinalis TaxID=161448 RepID=UPI0025A59114|nr:ephexin-1 [Corythoichthys intestinalis]XP_061810619.1 ephexin-1-like [Nerophis lumbriciformis]